MKSIKKLFLYIIVLITFFGSTLHAQITIGSGWAPIEGALLELKEQQQAGGAPNATKGLVLPRVNLTNLKPNAAADFSASIGGSGDWDLEAHVGLMVYNVYEDRCAATPILKGIYVWSGTEWQPLFDINSHSPEVEIFTDTRDGKSEQYLTGDFGLAGRWFLENLRYLPADGSIKLNAASDTYTTMTYFYPNGTSSNVYGVPPSTWEPDHGLLYNWVAATYGQNASTSNQNQVQGVVPGPNEVESVFETPVGSGNKNGKIQGLCPAGWHIPSDREWNDLEREIYTSPQKYSKYADNSLFPNNNTWDPVWETSLNWRPLTTNTKDAQGKAMKSPCPISSSYPTNGNSSPRQQNGFSVLLIGYASKGNPLLFGQSTSFQSSSANVLAYAWSRTLDGSHATVYRVNTKSRSDLFSVRCKKD